MNRGLETKQQTPSPQFGESERRHQAAGHQERERRLASGRAAAVPAAPRRASDPAEPARRAEGITRRSALGGMLAGLVGLRASLFSTSSDVEESETPLLELCETDGCAIIWRHAGPCALTEPALDRLELVSRKALVEAGEDLSAGCFVSIDVNGKVYRVPVMCGSSHGIVSSRY
jgi:hypothetical protein